MKLETDATMMILRRHHTIVITGCWAVASMQSINNEHAKDHKLNLNQSK